MQRGTVKFFNNRDDKLYGFIIPDNQSDDVFFHFNNGKIVEAGATGPALKDGDLRMPRKGDYLVFEVVASRKGPKVSVWAFSSDWERELHKSPDMPDFNAIFGYCAACRKEVQLIPVEPRHADDPMLEETSCYSMKDHVSLHGGGIGSCSGSGQHPKYICEDDLDGEAPERHAEDEERYMG
jgi:cold shock CspA family protein